MLGTVLHENKLPFDTCGTVQVFLATDGILLDGNDNRTALGFVSAVGSETVLFDSPVELQGKVEIYLTHILKSTQATLKVCAPLWCRACCSTSHDRLCLQRYMMLSYDRYGGDRCAWLLAKPKPRPSGGLNPSSIDPAQLALFVSGVKFVEDVEAAFVALRSGHADALTVPISACRLFVLAWTLSCIGWL